MYGLNGERRQLGEIVLPAPSPSAPDRARAARAAAAIDRTYLGLNNLAVRLIAAQVAFGLLTAIAFRAFGLSLDLRSALPLLAFDLILFILWAYLYRTPGRPQEWIITETIFGLLLVLGLSHIGAPAQYAAAAMQSPLVDPVLARADYVLGISVPAIVEWVRQHPTLNTVLVLAYSTLLAQFALILPVLGLFLRDRDALWEYIFHFHVCALVTVLALAIVPAACAFQFYGFQSTLDQGRFIQHFNGFRAGTLTLVRFNDLEGLISVPSFHVAGALMVTWALRRNRWLFAGAGVLNVVLIAATFMTGAHYFVDVLVTFVLFGASLVLYRRWGRALLYS